MLRLAVSVFIALLLLPSLGRAESADLLLLKAPTGFTELNENDTDLFRDTQQAVSHGKLLRIYLPQYIAHQYKYGNRDAVTRQVLICAMKGQRFSLDDKAAELLSRSMEGLFTGFSQIHRSRTDTPAQEMEKRGLALQNALEKGTPLLVDSVRTSKAYMHTCIIPYNMTVHGPKSFLSAAITTAFVPVKDTALFVTVSSVIGNDEPEPHLEWVKGTASVFADMIVSVNKNKKKPTP